MQRCVDTMYIWGVSEYTTVKEAAHTRENWATGGEKTLGKNSIFQRCSNPPSTFSSCKILDKLVNLFVFQFPHL